MRIVRICTDPENRDKRHKEFTGMLLARNYQEYSVKSAISKARSISRHVAQSKLVIKNKTSERPVFAIKFDPRLPSISQIQAKHYRAMTSQDEYLKQCFNVPPLIAYKKQNNLKDPLLRAKVPPKKEIMKREI